MPSGRFFERMGRESNQLHETNKAHAAFLIYCSLGPGRTLEKVRQQMNAKPSYRSLLLEWSAKYHWVGRAKSYDREVAAEDLRAQEKALRQMNERHAQTATTAQVTALEYIMWQIKNKKMGSIAAVALLKNLFDLERLARGGTTEAAKVELTGPAGSPIPTDVSIKVYLPQKDPLPQIVVESETGETRSLPVPLPEDAETLKRRLAEQIASYLSPKQDV